MQKFKNTLEEFGAVAKFLHWFMAFAIIAMFIVGFIMADMQPSQLKCTAYTLHKSTGLLYVFQKNPELSQLANQVHTNAAFAFVGFLFLHVLGAFYHHFALKDTVLVRMLPRRR
jgi:cytochrome b561